MPAVRAIARKRGPDAPASSLVVGIVKSVPFQMKRRGAEHTQPG